VNIAPLQKPNLDIWRPNPKLQPTASWVTQTIEINSEAVDIAIGLSVTQDVKEDVETYLASINAPAVRRLVLLSPEGGPSPLGIQGPDHAYQLACELPKIFKIARTSRQTRVHVFFACPNSLMFFIGQQREALGRIALYEFDSSMDLDESYKPSFSLPLS
jgi:hypothetical protein